MLRLSALGALHGSCRWLFVSIVWSVWSALLKLTELLLPRLFWHCFSILLVLPDYLLHAAMCLVTCCESLVLSFCQHKEPAWVNCCLPLNAWARFSLNPRTICKFTHIAIFERHFRSEEDLADVEGNIAAGLWARKWGGYCTKAKVVSPNSACSQAGEGLFLPLLRSPSPKKCF